MNNNPLNSKIGIICDGGGIGDNIIITSLPENFYKNTGQKLIILPTEKSIIFKFNPFVDFDSTPDLVFSSHYICSESQKIKGNQLVKSISDKHNSFFDLPKLYLRHPRLYIFEDLETKPNKICIHTSSSGGRQFNSEQLNLISKKYSQYEITQIGGIDDIKMPGAINKTGLNLFNSAKEIADSAIFIGVNSGMYHLACCYPKVRKKILFSEYNEDLLNSYIPLLLEASWWEFNIESFCNYEYDVGVAMSFLKI